MRAIIATALLGATASSAAAAGPPHPSPSSAAYYPSPWGRGGPGGWDAAHASARAFVSRLTLAEKVNLTTGTGWSSDLCVGATGSVPRLGLRGLCLEDGPLGVRYTDKNSAFSAGVNAAATWSRDLIRRRGEAMGAEFAGKGIDIQLGPVAGPLGRTAAGGRNWEGFSPDPYLTGVSIAETVVGIQSKGVVACAKHYILNEQEHFRNSISSNLDDKTMHELYLWPFADAVRAGVGSIMCAYNQVNGAYSCENAWAQNHLLKNELDFQGFVMSDWGAQHTTVDSALAGLDMAMPGDGARNVYGSLWGGALTEAVLAGQVPQWRLDDMCVRILAALYKVGRGPKLPSSSDGANATQPDAGLPDINFSAWTRDTEGWLHPSSNRSWAVVNAHVDVQAGGEHAALIREVGAKSTVLLKNLVLSGTGRPALPLGSKDAPDADANNPPPRTLAVIGEDAQPNPAGPNACADRGCDTGTLAMAWGSATCEFPYLVAPVDALRTQAAADGTRLLEVEGNYDLDKARAAAREADVALVFANADAGENFIIIDGNAGDRNNLTLWKGADALIEAVAAVNPNTVVILHTVGPVLVEAYRTHPNISAILWAGLPGQESGNSLADVLYGRVNPQAKSVFTWGKAAADWGPDAQIMYRSNTAPPTAPQQDFVEGVFIDYRHFDRAAVAPSFEFGFGLSYTTFAYAALEVEKVAPAATTAAAPTAAGSVTAPAPTFGVVDLSDPRAALAPPGFQPIPRYIYPWLSSASSVLSGSSAPQQQQQPAAAAAVNGSAQPLLPAGGAPGGNPSLYEVAYRVRATVSNTGGRLGTEVPQLYVALGGPDDPKVVLRGFDEVTLLPYEEKVVTFELTRRDVSSWDSESQNWVVTDYPKTVFVGASSRDLRLNGTLT